MTEKYEVKTVSADSSACHAYIARVLEEEAIKDRLLEKRVYDEFLNRFNGSEQIIGNNFNNRIFS